MSLVVRVRTDDEHLDSVLDAIRPLEAEVITAEESWQETALFLFSRLNSKLDNLGQLKHLHKVSTYLSDLRNALRPVTYHFEMKNEELAELYTSRENYYKELAEKYGVRPPTTRPIRYMHVDSIGELFREYAK